jgi:hypothetical protein
MRVASLLILLAAAARGALVTVRNDVPRVDQFGHIVNAHDGSVVHFEGTIYDGTYFMFGTVYENCTQHGAQCESPCGYAPNVFSLYTSNDLESWTLQSTDILPEMTKDNNRVDYWMPVVERNPATGLFVMQYWSGRCGFAKPCADIAVARSPFGPFTMAPPLALTAVPSSQMGFFADADGTAYVKYNTGAPQHHVVQKLAPDWMSTTDEYAILLWKPSFAWMEGGGMFKRGALYYYMTLVCGRPRRRVPRCAPSRPPFSFFPEARTAASARGAGTLASGQPTARWALGTRASRLRCPRRAAT